MFSAGREVCSAPLETVAHGPWTRTGTEAFDAEGGAPNLNFLTCLVVNGHRVVGHGVVNNCSSEEFSVVVVLAWDWSMGARRHDRSARWVTNMRAWAARRNISVSWPRPAARHLSSSLLLLGFRHDRSATLISIVPFLVQVQVHFITWRLFKQRGE